MIKALRANIKTNLTFYRRNSMLMLAALVMLALFVIMSVPSLMFVSASKKFEIIKLVFSQMRGFFLVLVAMLGLITIPYHINSRNIKMVLTKPCPVEIWLLAHFLSAALVAVVLQLIMFTVVGVLFFVWKIPWQWGVLYTVINNFMVTMVVFSYITFLSALFHPIISAMVALFFTSGTFYYLIMMIEAGSKIAGIRGATLEVIGKLLNFIYMIIPIYNPFSDEKRGIYNSMRVIPGDMKYLLYTLGYTILISAFFYFLTSYFIRKKRYI